jgi:flagellar hook-associated protein 3
MAILPVSTTRVSNSYINQRLLSQIQSDNTDLLKLETELSTGKRYTLGSEDPPAAKRAAELQSLLQRKAQAQTNISAGQSFLSTTDSALGQISTTLTSIRATALGVVGNTATDAQRAAAAQEVQQAIQQFLTVANQKIGDRYLFSGSRTTTQPFTGQGSLVRFDGNNNNLQSYGDTNLLFQTNADGGQAIGGLSAGIQGSVDLNPVISENTRLADLRGGQGITRGSIVVSDGTNSATIDLSHAETVGDVLAALRANPPQGRKINASLSSQGINVSLDSAGGGNLTIQDVGSGTTAAELGILETAGVGTGVKLGADINPNVTKETLVSSLLGVPASVKIASPGSNNDLIFSAKQNGANLNGVTISFVANATLTAGNETVAYNAGANTLTFQVAAGQTTANQIVHALANDPTARAIFTARADDNDTSHPIPTGTSAIDYTQTGTFSGGSGANLDLTSGIQITSGGQTVAISFTGVKTVEDLLNKINGSGAGAIATINAAGSGIDVQSRVSGADFSIGENGGQTATQLGIRTFSRAVQLTDLNHGLGVHEITGNDFQIRRPDGVVLSYDVSGLKTVGDVIDAINNDVNNQDATHKVTARLASVGNGIELVSTDPATTTTLQVSKINGSQAAEDLGLVPVGATTSNAPVVAAGTTTLTGRDTHPLEVSSVFNTLARLQAALSTGDTVQISRAISLLDGDTTRVNLSRAEIGARQSGLDTLNNRLADEKTSLTSSLSDSQDADLAQVITDLTSKQAAYQGSLKAAAIASQLSLLNYL